MFAWLMSSKYPITFIYYLQLGHNVAIAKLWNGSGRRLLLCCVVYSWLYLPLGHNIVIGKVGNIKWVVYAWYSLLYMLWHCISIVKMWNRSGHKLHLHYTILLCLLNYQIRDGETDIEVDNYEIDFVCKTTVLLRIACFLLSFLFIILAFVIFSNNLLSAASICCPGLTFSIFFKTGFTGISCRKHRLKHGCTDAKWIFKNPYISFP